MQFNVSFDVADSPDLGSLTSSEQQAVLDTVNTAAAIWSWYLTPANVTLSLSLTIDNSAFSGNVLAEGGPAVFYSTPATFEGKRVYDTNTAIELRTGQDRNGSAADLGITLTANSIRNLLTFKTDDTAAVAWNRCDALSVFLHEIGHGLGFSSFDGDSSAASVYDTFIQNGAFTGANAEQAAGMPSGVPLATGDFSHVVESGVFASDLMSPSLSRGTNIHVSALDLAILKDIGVPIRQASSGADVMHALFGTALYLGAGNDAGYAVAGGSAIYGEEGDDQLFGGKRIDFLYGGNGNDYLEGGAGNDAIDGGAGQDKVGFSANYASYAIVDNGGGSLTVSGTDGTDTLTGIEQLVFTDRVYNAAGFVSSNRSRSDLNADGKSDFVWQNENGQVGVWLMNGATIVSDPLVGSNPGPAWHVMGSGDLNGDGYADIVWQHSSGQAGIWLMNGSAIASDPTVGGSPDPDWKIVGTGDFDGNGKADLAWQNTNGQAAIWVMDGPAIVSQVNVGSNPGAAWHIAATGDLNNDGKTDIVWQNDNGGAGVWLMNGSTVLLDRSVGGSPDANWRIVGTGDFDGNGKADLLWQNINGQAAVWMMDGSDILAQVNVGSNPGPAWKVKGAGDLNGDGKADILWQNVSGQAGAWLMSGTTILSGPTLGSNPGSSWHLVANIGG